LLYICILRIEDISKPQDKKTFKSNKDFIKLIGAVFIPYLNIIASVEIFKNLVYSLKNKS